MLKKKDNNKNQLILTLNKVVPPIFLIVFAIIGFISKHSFWLFVNSAIILILAFKVVSNSMIVNRVEQGNKLLLSKLKRKVIKNLSTLKSNRMLLVYATNEQGTLATQWEKEVNKFIDEHLSKEEIVAMNIPINEARYYLQNYINDLLFLEYDFDKII